MSLAIPDHFDPQRVGTLWKVDYQQRADDARAWSRTHGLRPAATDPIRVGLLLIDLQNTFCLPGFELFVGGRSGTGAVDDNARLCAFLYRNLATITEVVATLDTHCAAQIFHPIFLIDAAGEPPPPMTTVSLADVRSGRWRTNSALAPQLGLTPAAMGAHLEHYCRELEAAGKYQLMIWPYHAMLGGVGHALVPSVEEAVFFHGVARSSQPRLELKGRAPLTENYSALQPEVRTDRDGAPLVELSPEWVDRLLGYDALIVAGQAKSHCVAATVDDLLAVIRARDSSLARRVYLLEDCASAVVIPDVVDFTDPADQAYARFAAAGMHVVQADQPVADWPGFPAPAPRSAP